jgi:hypothetical protein
MVYSKWKGSSTLDSTSFLSEKRAVWSVKNSNENKTKKGKKYRKSSLRMKSARSM